MDEDLHQLGEDLVTISGRVIRWVPTDGFTMSLAAARLLARLLDNGPTRISDLATQERSSQPTITNHVKRLEAAGLVARAVDPDDLRAWRIDLTPAGRESLNELRDTLGTSVEPALAQLSKRDLKALRAGLEVMRRLVAADKLPGVSFRLYDTATRTVRDFVPVTEGKVSIYHCGLTVQASPHVGHIRKEVVFDVLRRWLTYSGFDVTVIANVTDIDDKILIKSAEAGVPWFAHAYRYERELHHAYAALGCVPPTYEPRATGHVPEMIELIKVLIERGHAYPAADESGDVYFDVRSWPAYGSLSGQKIDEMEPAADADPRGKRDPRDFALWKGHKPDEPATASWVTPWGRGRPGWHLECSAMAGKYLGDEFDIHGGGLDLRFPHHENELAQSTAAGQRFARLWMHNAWVTAAGEKMSKSLGNGALVSEVTARYPARAVRFYLATPHYRSAIEFSDTSLDEAAAALERIDGFVARAGELVGPVPPVVPDAFAAAMDDDLGTPAATAVLYEAVRLGNTAVQAGAVADVAARLGEVRGMLGVLGLDLDDPVWAEQAEPAGAHEVIDGLVAEMLKQRAAARARKDYAAADGIRDALARLGVQVEDTPQGPRWSLRRTSGTDD